MAKGIGLIGNFRGKVGNMVGYNLKDSNNKQTQGVRVYQPVVKNPKTYGQAEQRAKLAPINATYRALKAIIDRGQEGKAYGNKSRLAWLSDAMKSFNGGWFEKGAAITVPAWVQLTKGSLPAIAIEDLDGGAATITCDGLQSGATINTVATFSTAILAGITGLKAGDQITFVSLESLNGSLNAKVESVVLSTTDATALPFTVSPSNNAMSISLTSTGIAAAIIVSREGDNGQHLRSDATLVKDNQLADDKTSNDDKEAAIKSYMSAGANTDWAEESLQ